MFANFRVLILLALISSALGCGSGKAVKEYLGVGDKDNAEPPSPLVDFIETADVREIWSESVGKGTDELFIKLVPSILDSQIFIADTRGNIAALNTENGKSIWEKDIDLPITGGPGADQNLVMVGTSEGDVVSLSAETGEQVWQTTVSSEILSPPRESDGVVIARTIDGKIFAIDAASGERLWIYDRTVPTLTLRGTSTPVISNDRVIAGFDGGRVAALALKTGKLIWEKRVAISSGRSELERMVDVDVQPLIVGEIIYVTTFQADVTALSLDTGQILWQRDISSHSELVADEKKLYVTDEDSHIWALDRFSGASVWKQEKLYARQVSGPAILENKVIVGDLEGYLHWLNKETGEFASRNRVSRAPILTQAISSNDKLFAYSSDGTLSALTYTDNGIDAPKQSLTREVPEEATTDKTASGEESDSSFFDNVLNVFTGEPDDEEEEEEIKKEDAGAKSNETEVKQEETSSK